MKTAIFLGAGASKADGAPLQKDLFREYFSILAQNKFKKNILEMDKEIGDFFKSIFNIDINNINENDLFPTFEEVLGIIDLAELRKESLRNFELENIRNSKVRIRNMRIYFILLMAKIIDFNLKVENIHHNRLINNLLRNNVIHDTCFISTNYDILIDNALSKLYRGHHIRLDYGIDFVTFDYEQTWQTPDPNAIKLFKLHGSLNWLCCPTCSNIKLTQYEKGIMRLLTSDFESSCRYCGSVYMPIIVPPTFFKDMSNVFLSSVWNKAENTLRNVGHLIFCGYSFPDADIHLKYLLKRIQTSSKKKLRITVINHCDNKTDDEMKWETDRFRRFFGQNIDYKKNNSFQDFANDPIKFW